MEAGEIDVQPKGDDTISFVNSADITHSLYLTYENGQMVDLEVQIPDTTKTTTLEQSGKVVVRCWIHPVIRIELDVAPAGRCAAVRQVFFWHQRCGKVFRVKRWFDGRSTMRAAEDLVRAGRDRLDQRTKPNAQPRRRGVIPV